ncbi:hypothetical protein BGZ70_002618 [Mortierella alpina]|uniref:DinB-like domain-containing protein n=1 Tax=Mortierella alpina TaxID=64518 RepID=A0A9P6JBD0_MORAP|nr:hypothetical protein BGZ70_002618 [Mortierella alpina]
MATASTLPTDTAAAAAARTADPANDSHHIFTVAARSLRDCVELLLSLKAAMSAEEREEQQQQRQQQQHHETTEGHTNGSTPGLSNGHSQTSPTNPAGKSMRDIHHMSRSASQEAEVGSDASSQQPQPTADRAPLALPQAITPCRRSEMYTKPSVLACQGTIGKHVRHLHDHYRLLLSTYPPNKDSSVNDEWILDYDRRSREVPMETDIDHAIQELERLQFILEKYQTPSDPSVPSQTKDVSVPSDLLQPVTLQATIDPRHPPVSFQTTFGRELWFCSLHAVHHFAMIKVICGEFGMPLTEDFGLAPSTVKSRLPNQ